MPALDRFLPVAASASILVCVPLAGSSSSAVVRVPTTLVQLMARYETGPTMANKALLSPAAAMTGGNGQIDPVGTFTHADMAVLDMVDRANAVDDLDYSGLFDYDDD